MWVPPVLQNVCPICDPKRTANVEKGQSYSGNAHAEFTQNGIGITLDFKHYSSTFEFEQSDHCKMELKGGNWKNKRYSTFQYAFFQY